MKINKKTPEARKGICSKTAKETFPRPFISPGIKKKKFTFLLATVENLVISGELGNIFWGIEEVNLLTLII